MSEVTIFEQKDYAIKKMQCKLMSHFTALSRDAILRPMETIKTATFEALMELAIPDGDGGYLFTLDGEEFRIKDTLEISGIATRKGYIIIY